MGKTISAKKVKIMLKDALKDKKVKLPTIRVAFFFCKLKNDIQI
jgi:hypothetical protein